MKNNYQYKKIDKTLPRIDSDIAFEVTNEVRKLGLNRYEFKHIREKIYLEAEKLYHENIPGGAEFKKKLEQVANKYTSKALRKTPIEITLNFIFVIFIIISFSFPFVYGLNFLNKPDNSIYSNGLNLYVTFNNLCLTFIYLSLGVLVATFIQNIEKKKKNTLAIIVVCVGAAISLILYALGQNFKNHLAINFIALEIVSIILTLSSYFIEDKISKKRFTEKHKINL